jgi:hypothetical protein
MQIDLPDRIERARAQWADEEPGLDTSPMEVIGRILRAAHLADTRIRRVLRQESLDRSGFDVLATLRRSGPPYRLTPTALYRDLVHTRPWRPPQQPRRPHRPGQVGGRSRDGGPYEL